VALDKRKSVLVLAALLVLVVLLGWAWADGGERPLTPHGAPAMLPGSGQ
jgi:hypothetical protein